MEREKLKVHPVDVPSGIDEILAPEKEIFCYHYHRPRREPVSPGRRISHS